MPNVHQQKMFKQAKLGVLIQLFVVLDRGKDPQRPRPFPDHRPDCGLFR